MQRGLARCLCLVMAVTPPQSARGFTGLQRGLFYRPRASSRFRGGIHMAATMDSNVMQGSTNSGVGDVYFIMGGPGCGKGTQCAKLVNQYGFTHFSAGDLLREEASASSDLGRTIANILEEGKIVPSEVTVQLLVNAMARNPGPYLVDGFPRSMENLQAFEERVGTCRFMLFLDAPQEVMQERLLLRSQSSGRSDDNEVTIRKRFDTFVKVSMPVVEHLEERSLVRRVSALGSPAEVFASVSKLFEDAPHPSQHTHQ